MDVKKVLRKTCACLAAVMISLSAAPVGFAAGTAKAEQAQAPAAEKESYDILQNLYLTINQDMSYEAVLKLFEPWGLSYGEMDDSNSDVLSISYTDTLGEGNKRNDNIRIDYSKQKRSMLACAYYNKDKDITLVDYVSGSFYGLDGKKAGLYSVADKKITANKTKHEQLKDIPVNGKHLITSKQITFHNNETPKEALPAPASSIQVKPAPSQAETQETVYWTAGGKSYHYTKDCVTLKRSKKVVSGSLSEALKSGKNDPCNICANG